MLLLLLLLTLVIAATVLLWRSRTTSHGVVRLLSRSSSRPRRDVLPRALLLVIAHPDDETMFFSPLLLSNRFDSIDILCLSHGDTSRAAELRRCARETFGAKAYFSARQFRDGMDQQWDVLEIHNAVQDFIRENYDVKSSLLVATFDDVGVSRHPNHIAVSRGVRSLALTTTAKEEIDIHIYCLRSERHLPVKYSSVLGAAIRLYVTVARHTPARRRERTDALLFLNHTPFPVHRGMTLHASQYAWFRVLFVLFSTTTYLNVMDRIRN